MDRAHFDKSRSKKGKQMSEDGDQIDEANLVGAEMLRGERVDAAFATVVGPDLVCVDSGCNKIILMAVPENQDGRTTYGPSLVVDPWGDVLLDMGEGAGLALADLDLTRVEAVRGRVPAIANRRVIPQDVEIR